MDDLYHERMMLQRHVDTVVAQLEYKIDAIARKLDDIPVEVNNDVVRITDTMDENFEVMIKEQSELTLEMFVKVTEDVAALSAKLDKIMEKVNDIQEHLELEA